MLDLDVTFTARRFHGTPWGAAVNEARVEWPPSPWRLLRALMAGWYRLEDPDSEPVMQSIVGKLASTDPHYRVPAYCEAHTRHYMPTDSSTTLVFDAFIQMGEDNVLGVRFPGVELDDVETSLLDQVVAQLGYLGRSESWVEVRRSSHTNGDHQVVPGRTPGCRSIPAARSPEEYEQWSAQQRRAIKKKSERPPASLWEALGMTTTALQKARWSGPPAMRQVDYNVAELRPRRPTRAPSIGASRAACVARFALVADQGAVLPTMTRGLRVAEAIHARLARLGNGSAVPLLTGKRDKERLRNEGHAYVVWSSERGGRDANRITHVHVALPSVRPHGNGAVHTLSFSTEELAVLRMMKRVEVHGSGFKSRNGDRGQRFRLVLEAAWSREDLDELAQTRRLPAPLGRARVWRSETPLMLQRHPKTRGDSVKDGPIEQVVRYLRQAGFPEASVELAPDVLSKSDCLRFVRSRLARRRGQTAIGAYAFRLRFDQPVAGPIALGAFAHFGMGRFAPDE